MQINTLISEALAAFANTLLHGIQEQLVPFEERLTTLEKNTVLLVNSSKTK